MEKKTLFNRELSWLEFNGRVLNEARNKNRPILDRLKFTAIYGSNLDEFLMVRVACLRQLHHADPAKRDASGMKALEQLSAIREKLQEQLKDLYEILNDDLLPELAKNNIKLTRPDKLSEKQYSRLQQEFEREILPVLTPVAVDPSHPFPLLRNEALELAVLFERPGFEEPVKAFVEVPSVLPRFIPVNASGANKIFVLLEDVKIENILFVRQA